MLIFPKLRGQKLWGQKRYCFVIYTKTWVTYWHYTQQYSSLVISRMFWVLNWWSPSPERVHQQWTKQNVPDLPRNQPGHASSLPQVRPAINIPAGKTEGVFFTLLPGRPHSLCWGIYQHCLHLAVTQQWHQAQDFLVLMQWHFWTAKRHSLRNLVNDIWIEALTLRRLRDSHVCNHKERMWNLAQNPNVNGAISSLHLICIVLTLCLYWMR